MERIQLKDYNGKSSIVKLQWKDFNGKTSMEKLQWKPSMVRLPW